MGTLLDLGEKLKQIFGGLAGATPAGQLYNRLQQPQVQSFAPQVQQRLQPMANQLNTNIPQAFTYLQSVIKNLPPLPSFPGIGIGPSPLGAVTYKPLLQGAGELAKQLIYNPDTKKLFPQSMLNNPPPPAMLNGKLNPAAIDYGSNLAFMMSGGTTMKGLPVSRTLEKLAKDNQAFQDFSLKKTEAEVLNMIKSNSPKLEEIKIDLQKQIDEILSIAPKEKLLPKTSKLVSIYENLIGKIENNRVVKESIPSKLPKFTYNPLEKLDNLPPLRNQARGGYTNVRELDNPLIKGQQFIDTLKKGVMEADPMGQTPLTKKINIWNRFFATPDRVLEKIGLKPQMTFLRTQWDKYLTELPQEISRVTEWSKRALGEEINKDIFKYLDGQPVTLTGEPLKVANEIKSYLKVWAQRLGLPPERRISSYITHLFEKNAGLEFDEEIAKIIDQKVAGSVYDPFLLRRKGGPDYLQDTWQALDAYVKRAVRKVNLDPALSAIEKASRGLELGQYKYVENFISKVNLRPSSLDNDIDTTIKQLVGYRFGVRPTASLTRTARQIVYRGTLGLNPATALKNLMQGSNTLAKAGVKNTLNGYINMVKELSTGGKELETTGILRDRFIEDRTINATKKFWETADKGLFSLFDFAEKVNRGAAYFAGKSQLLAKGASEAEAIQAGKKMVADTQFLFSSIDTPAILSSDIGKLLGQFQSYNLKQLEFLGEMVKNKEFAGLIRYALANLVLISTVGQLFGMKIQDMIPSFRLGLPPTLNLPVEVGKAGLNVPNQYRQIPTTQQKLRNIGNAAIPFIPGGIQLKKTFQGLQSYGQGYSQTSSGNMRFPVEQTPENLLKSILFGQYATPEARKYFDTNARPLSEKQTAAVRTSVDQAIAYNQIMQTRQQNALIDQAKEVVKTTGIPSYAGDNYIFVDKSTGEIRAIDTSFQPTQPALTGQTEVDKLLISKFTSEITKKKNIILDLLEQGRLDATTAEQQLADLISLKTKVAKAKSKKLSRISLPKIKIVKIPAMKTIKISKAKLIKIARIKPAKTIKIVAKKLPNQINWNPKIEKIKTTGIKMGGKLA